MTVVVVSTMPGRLLPGSAHKKGHLMGFLKHPVAADELPPKEKSSAPDSFAGYVNLIQSTPGKWYKIADEVSSGTISYLQGKYPDFEFANRLMAGKPYTPGTTVKDKEMWVRYGGTEFFLARKAKLDARATYGSAKSAA